MSDLVVLIPGITGSALAIDGTEIWGMSGRAVMRGVATFGGSVKRLKLLPDIGSTLPLSQGKGNRRTT